MAVDLKEEEMIKQYLEDLRLKEEGGYNEIEKGVAMTKKEIDEEFDNLDINAFNDGKQEHKD